MSLTNLDASPRELFPAVGLYGTKVVLRLFDESDITTQYLGWLHDPRVTRFSNQRFRQHSIDSARAYLGSFVGTDNLFLSIRSHDGQRALGTMTAYVARPHRTVDVGILVGETEFWGRGVGQDAWSTLVNWLLEVALIRKVTAGAVAANIGMVKVMTRSAMTLEATRRAQEIVEGRAEDLVYYARFRSP